VKGDHTFVIFEKAIAVLLFAMKKGDHSLVVFENAIAVLFRANASYVSKTLRR
jgi:hypothetical protein